MKRLIVVAVALTLMVGCAAGGSANRATSDGADSVNRVITKAVKAEAKVINQDEVFTSEMLPYRQNAVTPAASGVRVSEIYVEVGDRVSEGELLATLDPTIYDQQLISLNNLRSDYERLLPVYEAGGISKQTLDQMKSTLDIQSKVVADMKRNIELLSPISGVVTQRNTERGNLLDGRPIVEVAQIDSLKVMVNITEQYFPAVSMGMPVQLSVEIYGDRLFEGRVSLIYPMLDPATRTFTVEVSVPNKDELLRPGMHARSIFNMGSKSAIMVPDVAIQKQFGSAENYVYIVEDGVAKRRSVVKGRQVGSMVDVLSGLNVGDEAIVTAFSRIMDGTQVELVE